LVVQKTTPILVYYDPPPPPALAHCKVTLNQSNKIFDMLCY
jgi:hypothetical protein